MAMLCLCVVEFLSIPSHVFQRIRLTLEQFTDDLVFKGIKGGQEAARSLLRAAWNKVRYEQDFGDEDKMVVKVYANLKGLSQTYEERGTIKCCIELLDFVTGFNKTNEYCDYIDAGNAKEGADRKLKGKSL